MDAEGGSRRTVTRDPWVKHQWPTWSPDGERIAFSARTEAPVNIHMRRFEIQSDIHVVDLDDLSVRRLTNSRDFDGMPAWSPRPVAGAAD
jgi:Tol biopolymer transport system component